MLFLIFVGIVFVAIIICVLWGLLYPKTFLRNLDKVYNNDTSDDPTDGLFLDPRLCNAYNARSYAAYYGLASALWLNQAIQQIKSRGTSEDIEPVG